MLKIYWFLMGFLCLFSATAQINLNGGYIKVMPGTTLYTAADLNTATGTTLYNAGVVRVGTNLTNAGTLDNNGAYFIAGNFTTNNGVLVANNNNFTFNGVNNNSLVTTGSNSISNLTLSKNGIGSLTLGDMLRITGSLTFGVGFILENHIICNGHTLQLAPAVNITGNASSRYIVTGATGMVRKQALGASPFFFPVGYNTSTYNPISIANNGAVDTFNVQVQEQLLSNGTSGTPLTNGAVNASWIITETVPGASNLDITAYWSMSDHLSGFNPNDCGMAYWDGSDWELPPSQMGLATSSTGQFFRTRTGLTSFEVISVSGPTLMDKIQVNLKALLQGPYTGPFMTDLLRTKSLIPLTEPYTNHTGFVHVGRGGGETTTNTVLTSVTDQNAITDWVFVELRDGAAPTTVLQSRAALMQRDGDVVDTDGVSALRIPANDGSYYLALRHRNHLGIRTANPIALTELTSNNYDFTTALTQAVGSTPMATLSAGVYGMYGGNANSNTSTRATGPPTLNDYTSILSELGSLNFILNVYKRQDLNLDGDLRKTGPPSINDYTKLLNILGTPSNIINQAF